MSVTQVDIGNKPIVCIDFHTFNGSPAALDDGTPLSERESQTAVIREWLPPADITSAFPETLIIDMRTGVFNEQLLYYDDTATIYVIGPLGPGVHPDFKMFLRAHMLILIGIQTAADFIRHCRFSAVTKMLLFHSAKKVKFASHVWPMSEEEIGVIANHNYTLAVMNIWTEYLPDAKYLSLHRVALHFDDLIMFT